MFAHKKKRIEKEEENCNQNDNEKSFGRIHCVMIMRVNMIYRIFVHYFFVCVCYIWQYMTIVLVIIAIVGKLQLMNLDLTHSSYHNAI